MPLFGFVFMLCSVTGKAMGVSIVIETVSVSATTMLTGDMSQEL
jgi:hypothetical protein